MKKILYTLCILGLFAGCRSIEKLVEKGQYDDAIILSTEKLAGKKNKKTSHVQYLEEAFAKITQMDMDQIQSLDAENHPYNWTRVLSIGKKIERRQSSIRAFLPLISKDGYEADFNFVKTHVLINRALDGAAEHQYAYAQRILSDALKNKDKRQIQRAYHEFEEVRSFRLEYRDVYELMKLCRKEGVVEILLDMNDRDVLSMEEEILLEEMQDLKSEELNDFWTNYNFEYDSSLNYDLMAKFELTELLVSPEREIFNHHTDSKQIKDGWIYVKKKNGEIKTDSLGNKIKRDIFRTVEAHVSELTREKSALLSGKLILTDLRTMNTMDIIRFVEENHFEDYSLRFQGDKRALCDHDINRLKDSPLMFPSDMAMLLSAGDALKYELINELRDIQI